MNDQADPTITVNLPANLAARVEALKQDRAQDRDKSIQDLVREWCEDYVAVRELARQERASLDISNRAYDDCADDWENVPEWHAKLPAIPEDRP